MAIDEHKQKELFYKILDLSAYLIYLEEKKRCPNYTVDNTSFSGIDNLVKDGIKEMKRYLRIAIDDYGMLKEHKLIPYRKEEMIDIHEVIDSLCIKYDVKN